MKWMDSKLLKAPFVVMLIGGIITSNKNLIASRKQQPLKASSFMKMRIFFDIVKIKSKKDR